MDGYVIRLHDAPSQIDASAWNALLAAEPAATPTTATATPATAAVTLYDPATVLAVTGTVARPEASVVAVVLEAPRVSGLDELAADNVQLRVVGRTLPAQQWKVARELRRRIAVTLRDMDVRVQHSTDPNTLADPGDD